MTSGRAMASNPRYDGKPLLRMLELYVLRAIGELPPREHQFLDSVAPKLRKIYGGDGEWFDSIARAMHLPADMPIAIRGSWTKNLEIAQADSVTLHPQEFAEMFVDENFFS
ncbi:hypothetical protein [Rhizobium sp.]